MERREIFSILENAKISQYLEDMSRVHTYTKHYLLIAEEISESGENFLQPLKEHRDAYDHLMRIFTLTIKSVDEKFNAEEYIMDNVKKAFGHEYRAFFDMADWFTYICRKYIWEELSYSIKRKKYAEKYDFQKTRDFINKVSYMIVKYREEKDVSNHEPILSEVLKYKDTMDKLLEIYKDVQAL